MKRLAAKMLFRIGFGATWEVRNTRFRHLLVDGQAGSQLRNRRLSAR